MWKIVFYQNAHFHHQVMHVLWSWRFCRIYVLPCCTISVVVITTVWCFYFRMNHSSMLEKFVYGLWYSSDCLGLLFFFSEVLPNREGGLKLNLWIWVRYLNTYSDCNKIETLLMYTCVSFRLIFCIRNMYYF